MRDFMEIHRNDSLILTFPLDSTMTLSYSLLLMLQIRHDLRCAAARVIRASFGMTGLEGSCKGAAEIASS